MQDKEVALENARNGNQNYTDHRTILCVCSAGMLRSATAAWLLSQEPYNFNTRAVGVADYALIPVNVPLLAWADCILCMNQASDMHETKIRKFAEKNGMDISKKKILSLNIPDKYAYRNPELVKFITERFKTRFPEWQLWTKDQV